MKNIYLLTDSFNRFGSKFLTEIRADGMDKSLLVDLFREAGYNCVFKKYSDIDFRSNDYRNEYFLYTSSEDLGGFYKSYVEDIVYALQMCGAIVIPEFKFLKSHHNKVFMEILRDLSNNDTIKNINSKHFGTWEELKNNMPANESKFVIKSAFGAGSKAVMLANNKAELIQKSKIISKVKNYFLDDLRDILRTLKFKKYQVTSTHRNKFIYQNFVSNLTHDWKILIFENKYYIVRRNNRKNDFRASGSGNLIYTKDFPNGIFDFAKEIFQSLSVPFVSLDIAYDGNEFYLIEFQCVSFGTFTIERSDFYVTYKDNYWVIINDKSVLEKEFVNSVVKYIEVKN